MRREQFSSNFNFEGTMLDHYFPQLIETPIYYPDGQILDEDYVYGSFIQSKMYRNNMACNNCHNSHSLKLHLKAMRYVPNAIFLKNLIRPSIIFIKWERKAPCASIAICPENIIWEMILDGTIALGCHDLI